MQTPPVKDMIAYMTSNPVIEGDGPKIHQLSWLEGMDYTDTKVDKQNDLFIVFADIEFAGGRRNETLKYWKGNLESSRNESGCFVFGFAEATEKPDHLFAVEAFESESYLWGVHAKAPAVQSAIENTKDVTKNLTLAKLKFHAGYLHK